MEKGTDKGISKKFEEQEEKLRNSFNSITQEIEQNKNRIRDLENKLEQVEDKKHKKKIKSFFENGN